MSASWSGSGRPATWAARAPSPRACPTPGWCSAAATLGAMTRARAARGRSSSAATAAEAAARRLDGAVVRGEDAQRLRQDGQVELDRPAADVRHVEPHPLLVAHVRAPVDLPVPGDAGPHVEQRSGVRAVPSQLVGRDRPRADQADVTLDDIDQLWQLVQRPPAEEVAERRHARVVGQLVGVLHLLAQRGIVHELAELRLGLLAAESGAAAELLVHRPELVQPERLAALADALV